MRIPEKTTPPIAYAPPVQTPLPVQTTPSADTLTLQASAMLGLVFFSSSPAHADITVDGVATGKQTPVKIKLPPGVHHVEMECNGLKGAADDTVNVGKNRALHLQLQ
jgi:hypothetical protein